MPAIRGHILDWVYIAWPKSSCRKLQYHSGKYTGEESDHDTSAQSPESDFEDNYTLSAAETGKNNSDSDCESTCEDSKDEWNTVLSLGTWNERQDEEKITKEGEGTQILRVASIRAAEKVLYGPIGKAGGAKDKRGKKRGPYGVGGGAERTMRRKRAKLLKDDEANGYKASDDEINCQLATLSAKRPSKLIQKTLTSMLKTSTHTPGPTGISSYLLQDPTPPDWDEESKDE